LPEKQAQIVQSAMNELRDLLVLMKEIGPWVDAAQVTQDGDDLWSIVLDEDFVIEVEQDADRDALMLTVSLGSPPAENESMIHALLLQTNALWRDTGGIQLGLTGQDREVLLMLPVPLKELDVDSLGNCLYRFTDAALGWREVIAKTSDSAEPDLRSLEGMLKI
jgi:hypothetical protein